MGETRFAHESKDAFIERYFIGDDCVCWSFGSVIDAAVNRKVLYLYRRLKPFLSDIAIRDVVPAYKGLAVYFDPAAPHPEALISRIDSLLMAALDEYEDTNACAGRRVTIPVTYNGEDLSRVADMHQLTVEEVIIRHTSVEYQVALVGFKPHFPYLIGLDPDLATPRLDDPRTLVPAGSVAIGGAQTGIYPEDSPGGWNIVGRADPLLLKDIEPGDIVIFEEIKQK